MRKFDLCVIGSGPAGQRAAIQAAKLGKDVCVVERKRVVGGAAINTGTIPSKSLREAILNMVAGKRLNAAKDPFRASAELSRLERGARIKELMVWCDKVIATEIEVATRHLLDNGVLLKQGTGRFAGPHTLEIVGADEEVDRIEAERFVIAVGTRPARPERVPFDGRNVVDSDEILRLDELPRSLIVVGGGVIGTEYASMMQSLGVKVTLVEGRSELLEFLDDEIGEALQYHLRREGMTLRLGEKVVKISKIDPPAGARTSNNEMVEATLESGKTLRADCLLYSVGRQGSTDGLQLDRAGLEADDRGRLEVDENYRTKAEHIWAVGDVIGFPALASTSMEQGRAAALRMFGEKAESLPELFPYGIYSIPEISMVGWTEQRLTQEGIPYESGVAQYREIARAQLMGDEEGVLKMLVHPDSRAILGVHCIGAGATELIHIGQAVMAFKGTVDYFINAVFNYPTLAECYKVAAYNAANKIRHV